VAVKRRFKLSNNDTLKINFVEAFGKPKLDGIREERMSFRLILGPGLVKNSRSVFESFADEVRGDFPEADIELLSLETETITDESGAELLQISIEFMTDKATAASFGK
jgi:hypothetical protein